MTGSDPPAPNECPEAWTKTAGDVIAALGTDADAGLSSKEAERRLATVGPNELRARSRRPVFSILADQFRSIVILLLVAASGIAFAFTDALEGFAILAVVFINTGLGFVTEWRATRSMEALGKLGRVETVVIRDDDAMTLPAEQLVPGDIVLREGGDVVTADMRLIEVSAVQTDESALTGESTPVDKQLDPLPASTPVMDRSNMLFKGTAVTRGSARAVVVATGLDSELGQIAELVQSAEPQESPLEKRLDQMAGRLVWLVLLFAVFLAVAGVVVGEDVVLAIEVAIALAVAAIPEGLPVVATIALARGLWRMARKNALISRLSAVETLGATSVILTDKTGTLTENRMHVAEVAVPERTISMPAEDSADRDRLRDLMTIAALCSNAELALPDEDDDVGDPMELALLAAARSLGFERPDLLERYPELEERSFDPHTKLMATIHESVEGRLVAVKGAPEAVIAKSVLERQEQGSEAMTDEGRGRWLEKVEQMGTRGLRTLAIAVTVDGGDTDDVYDRLEMLGLVGLEDPARAGVREAIGRCEDAGIQVIMLTGDHSATARKIAEDVGILDPEDSDDLCIRGDDLDIERLHDNAERFDAARVFSRVTPAQKLALIGFHQARNRVVAMTGDGVNDAPALKKADIGVAMGIRGTAVAKESAAMILQDDEFGTIVEAVRQGRAIYENIRKFVVYLLSCNISEVLVVGLATIAGAPLPLLPLQILFLNLVTDVFPALALGVGEGGEGLMQRRPRTADEPLLTQPHWISILGYGLLISFVVLASMAIGIQALGYSDEDVVTVSFCTLALAQVWHVFNMHGGRRTFGSNDVTRNPWIWSAVLLCVALILAAVYLPGVSSILGLTWPGTDGWVVILGMSAVPLLSGKLVRAASARFTK